MQQPDRISRSIRNCPPSAPHPAGPQGNPATRSGWKSGARISAHSAARADRTDSAESTAAAPAAARPFTLTAQEEAQLDRTLQAWEKKSKEIDTFDCSFKRWEYDPIFPKPNSNPNAPVNIDLGILKYKSPDKGVFRVLNTEGPDGKPAAIEDDRADHWICDGKSVFQYIPKQKKLVEHKLPPEMQGKAIVDGPLPFLFGAEAKNCAAVFSPSRNNAAWQKR